MSDRQFDRALTDWLDDGTDRAPAHAIDAVLLAVKTTPQERDLRIPWRLPMPAFARATAIAAVALVAVAGAGGLVYLTNRDSNGAATQPTALPAPTAAPVTSASPQASASPSPAPSIDVPAGFAAFTSPLYGYTIAYPEGWGATPATGAGGEDQFYGADDDIGVGVRKVPAGDGADLASVGGLTAWARTHCTERNLGACDTYADRVESMCLDDGEDPCRAAILVRSPGANAEEEGEYAFFGDWAATAGDTAPDSVVVVGTGRGDAYPGAARFGGAVQLLKTMLASMGVTPNAAEAADLPEVPGIAGWTPFTSPVYGYSLAYPEGWAADAATRAWERGVALNGASDQFVRPDNDLGIAVWQQPAGAGADLGSIDGLKTWSQAFCADRAGASGSAEDCAAFVARAVPMCVDAGLDECRPALLVPDSGANPDDDAVYAFVPDWHGSAGTPDTVTILASGRGDAYEGSAIHGGTTALLKGFLATMGVTTP